MLFAASRSQLADTAEAVQAAIKDIHEQLQGAQPDLTFVFATREHAPVENRLAERVLEATRSRHLLGCTAESIVEGNMEIEAGPAVSVWCAVLPEASIESFHLQFERTPDGLICLGFPDQPDEASPQTMFALGEPFSCPIDALIARLGSEAPNTPLIGGMASGGTAEGENRLFLNGAAVESGAVGVLVRGGPKIHSVVSQGCRPIGSTFVVTKAEQNVVFELGGRPPLHRFQELYAEMSRKDRELVRRGLHLGVVMNEYKSTFERGDFLISNVIGADHDRGAIAIGTHVRAGQTVQFHLRDAETADEDLRHLVSQQKERATKPAQAGLLFTCNGRGSRLFSGPHHDASVVQEIFGPLPLAGFFAQGELGPVGNKNYIHGFTASIALFE